ncbi:MAG: hypothetical protein ACKVP7_16640 [Hyphomicrobiaceae bacterium]
MNETGSISHSDVVASAGWHTTAVNPASVSWLGTILKNVFVLFVVAGSWLALETGYFSNDRTSRAEWDEMERLKVAGKAKLAYETSFDRNVLGEWGPGQGYWDFYNGATSETAAVANGSLEVRYTEPWIGVSFAHTGYAADRAYRVQIEAKVEEQAGAILMRNRQLDLMREKIPVTNGEFKPMTFYYVAPGGRLDQVRVIFMPDEPSDVKGKMTIRKFRIEQLGD